MSLERLITGLVDAGVSFVVVGMVAGQLHGSALATYDLDIVYELSEPNLDRLTTFLLAHDAYIKETWPNEGFASDFNRDVLRNERSLTLGTSEGELDVLDRIDGIGDFFEVVKHSQNLRLDGTREARIITLSGLIASKKASDREKDRLHLRELETLEDVRRAKLSE